MPLRYNYDKPEKPRITGPLAIVGILAAFVISIFDDDAFVMMPQIRIQREILESDTTRHLYVIRIVPEQLNCTRKEFFDALYKENVCPQVHYLPVYWHSYYESLGYKKGLCPNAESFYEEAMSIPLYFSMTDKDVEDVITAVKKVVEYYKK